MADWPHWLPQVVDSRTAAREVPPTSGDTSGSAGPSVGVTARRGPAAEAQQGQQLWVNERGRTLPGPPG